MRPGRRSPKSRLRTSETALAQLTAIERRRISDFNLDVLRRCAQTEISCLEGLDCAGSDASQSRLSREPRTTVQGPSSSKGCGSPRAPTCGGQSTRFHPGPAHRTTANQRSRRDEPPYRRLIELHLEGIEVISGASV